LKFKTHLQKNEKAILLELQAKHEKLLSQRESLTVRLMGCCREYSALCLKGAAVREIVNYAVYLEELRRQLERLEEALWQSQEAVDRQAQKVVAVSKDKRGLEILKDKQIELYFAMAKREEERRMEEFIMAANPAAAWR